MKDLAEFFGFVLIFMLLWVFVVNHEDMQSHGLEHVIEKIWCGEDGCDR